MSGGGLSPGHTKTDPGAGVLASIGLGRSSARGIDTLHQVAATAATYGACFITLCGLISNQ